MKYLSRLRRGSRIWLPIKYVIKRIIAKDFIISFGGFIEKSKSNIKNILQFIIVLSW